jgi:sterol desaturase/sphingolipid hydroxylase (fatty acid hydroxylase superfamily)
MAPESEALPRVTGRTRAFRPRAVWSGTARRLDRMSGRELALAYIVHPAVLTYVALLALCAGWLIHLGETSRGPLLRLALAASAGVVVYPLAWYLLHRFVLHGRWLYRSSLTAALWKRIHYDHHIDPHDLRVLFGAPATTLPTIAVVTLPIGAALADVAGAVAAFGGALVTTLVYEYCHCLHHLHQAPPTRWLRRLKRLHLLHHFHNEHGNYGIVSFGCDRLGGTYYDRAADVPPSPTVFNLGYSPEEQRRYPWVAQRSRSRERAS